MNRGYKHFCLMVLLSLLSRCNSSLAQSATYCNPLNLGSAYCAMPNLVEPGKHRTAADPVIVLFKDNYYLFATNQYGYWYSSDLSNWHFIWRRFLKPLHRVYADENIKTYWSAASGDAGEWLQSDLGAIYTVYAIQVNYADQDAELMGQQTMAYHQYGILGSADGKKWRILVDERNNQKDVPQDYVELQPPIAVRYLKIENKQVPTGKFALSGFRVFDKGTGTVPDTVSNFMVLRGESEPRNAWIKWRQSDDAFGYTIYFGIAPDKLYNSITVNGSSEYRFTGLDKGKNYFFQIEAFNQNGIGRRIQAIMAK